MARVRTVGDEPVASKSPIGSPELAALQVAPPSVLLKTPLVHKLSPQPTAYTVVGVCGSIARSKTCMVSRPFRMLPAQLQVSPPLLLLKMTAVPSTWPVPAYRLFGFRGSTARLRML